MKKSRSAEGLPPRLLATVWLPFALSYSLSQFFRSVNAVLSPDLVRELGLNPSELGMLTSAYMLTFAAVQLPFGLLLDSHGPRRVNAGLLLVAAAGSAMFGYGHGLATLTFARALIGLGVALCLMASMKAYLQWFSPSVIATLNGWTMAAGGLGALAATAPVEAALHFIDWRSMFYAMSVLTCAFAALLFWTVPEKPGKPHETWRESVAGLQVVARDPLFWKMGILSAMMSGTSLAMLGLWIAPWLRDVAGLARHEVGLMLAWMAAALTAGFATMGTLSDWLGRRGVESMTIYLSGLGVAICMLLLITLGVSVAVPLVIGLYSFAGASGQLVYVMLSRRFPHELAGRVSTANNMLSFTGAFIVQWGIGAVINLWPVNGEHYAFEGYRTAFGGMVVLQVIAFIVVALSRKNASTLGLRGEDV